MSSFGTFSVPEPINEPVLGYTPGSPEKIALKSELARQTATQVDVPLRIGAERVETGNTSPMIMPHEHAHILGHYQEAGAAEAARAIAAAKAAAPAWGAMPWEDRAGIFLRAANLLQGEFRDRINASTMLNQSKTVHQAEIDAAAELIDFLKFNVAYMERIYREQPISVDGIRNRVEYRPLDGFVFAVTPFNFTSIAANLAAAPVLCGNTVVWKPAPTAVLSAHYTMDLFEAAGLPPGVINFIPGPATEIGATVMQDEDLAGVHFTGSTAVFKSLWGQVGSNIDHYRSYPRVVGETGGKDFIFAHKSAEPASLATAMLRGAFEYQGQKCSAASRAYIPDNLWPEVEKLITEGLATMGTGDPTDFRNFMGAVIDQRAFAKQKAAIDNARASVGKSIKKVIGGEYDDSKGYFVKPTIIVSNTPDSPTMQDELFGPILTVYIYPADKFEATLETCNNGSRYALTGAIFANDRYAVATAVERLRSAAGNFYINDKPTGAVVGQQPFGGSRASGTNDKAGSMWNLIRWLSPRTIKENFAPPRNYRYGFMDEK